MSRVLVIDGHPDPDRKRYCHALSEAYAAGARETGNEVRCLTLAEMRVPLLRSADEFATLPDEDHILRARDDLLWCQHLVLVFPLWLGGAPALLRALLEQIGRGNFIAEAKANGFDQKLRGRSARVIVTMGMPALVYRFVFGAAGVRNLTQGVIGFGGVAPVGRTLFGAIEAVGDAERRRRIDKVRSLGHRAA